MSASPYYLPPDADNNGNKYCFGNYKISSLSAVRDLVLLFVVTLIGTNMFVALFLKVLFFCTKFYTALVPAKFGFCSKHMSLTSDHC